MTGQLVILSPLILFFIFLLLTIPRLNVLHFSIPLPMEEEEVWERRSYSKYSIGFTLCCLSRVSTKNVTTPMCVCVCVETRKKKTNKESFSILVGKDIPSIHLSGRSKRGLLLRVKTFGLSSCCVPCLMTLFTSLVSHRVFLVCFVYRNHIPPPTWILKHTITFECVENQTRLRKKGKSFLFSLFVKWKYWQRRFWSD